MTVSYRQPGVVLTDHRFTVPLDHDDPAGESVELFAREAVASDKTRQDLPWMVYLQGGPASAPTASSASRPGSAAR